MPHAQRRNYKETPALLAPTAWGIPATHVSTSDSWKTPTTTYTHTRTHTDRHSYEQQATVYSIQRQQSEGQEGTEILAHAWDMLMGGGAAWAPVLPLPPRGPWQQVTKGNAWLLTTHTHTHKFRQTDRQWNTSVKRKVRRESSYS